MGLSGLVGAGAVRGLEDILTEQMMKAKFAEEQRQAQAHEAAQREMADQGRARIALDSRRQDTADARYQDETQDRSIADMRAGNAAMDERMSRLTAEDELKSALARIDTNPNIPARVKQAGELQRVGIKNISPDDLKTADDLKADEDAYIRKMGGAADAQARAAARYREPKPTGPAGLNPGQLTTAKQFQDDYARDSKTYITVRNAYQQVASAAKSPDGAGDLSLLFGYMKMLDPNSVVRETEFANAESAMGYAQKVLNIPNKAITGQRLTPEARMMFANQARRIVENAQKNQGRVRETYGSRASKFGIDPTMVLDSEEKLDMGEDPGSGTVKMQAPTGQIKDVPADQVEAYKAKGAKVVG